jgi:hypothetical protein
VHIPGELELVREHGSRACGIARQPFEDGATLRCVCPAQAQLELARHAGERRRAHLGDLLGDTRRGAARRWADEVRHVATARVQCEQGAETVGCVRPDRREPGGVVPLSLAVPAEHAHRVDRLEQGRDREADAQQVGRAGAEDRRHRR